jgi:hypothetical protein
VGTTIGAIEGYQHLESFALLRHHPMVEGKCLQRTAQESQSRSSHRNRPLESLSRKPKAHRQCGDERSRKQKP